MIRFVHQTMKYHRPSNIPIPAQSLRLVRYVLVFAIFVAGAAAQTDPVDPEDAVALFNQGQDAHEKGDLKAAVELYQKALKLFPEFPEAEYQSGIAYLALGRRLEAEASFRRAVRLRPDWTLPMTGLGSLLVDSGKYSEAEVMLGKAIELEPQNYPAYASLAEIRLKSKAASPVLQELLNKIEPLTNKANPTSSLWSARAALENALGKSAAAKSSIAKAIQLDPKNKYALAEIAEIALKEGDIVRAADAATSLEKLAPDAVGTKFLRVRILAAEGKVSESLAILDSLGGSVPGVSEIRSSIVASSSENAPELEAMLKDDPKNSLILGRLCALYRVSSPPKALDFCRRASEIEPTNINHAVGFGAALVQAGQYEQAIVLYRKLIPIAPDNSTVHANLATALFQLKRYGEAKAEYRWLADRQPDLAIAYYFLGISHDQLAEYMDAMANYQQFLRLADPARSQLEIDKVNLRLPLLQKQIRDKKTK